MQNHVATSLLSCVAILEVEKFVMELHQYVVEVCEVSIIPHISGLFWVPG